MKKAIKFFHDPNMVICIPIWATYSYGAYVVFSWENRTRLFPLRGTSSINALENTQSIQGIGFLPMTSKSYNRRQFLSTAATATISHRVGNKKLWWDKRLGTFKENEMENALLKREYRKGYEFPVV